jgi:hypothetical protein
MNMLDTDYEISSRNLPVLLSLTNSLDHALAQSRAVADNAIDEGYAIPPDVHSTLVASLCRIQAALDQALTV